MSSEAGSATFKEHPIEEYYVKKEPFYLPLADEVQIFEAAYSQKMPVLLKGPTGCGKTRFLEYMAYKMGQALTKYRPWAKNVSPDSDVAGLPLITVACHDDLTASDLVGRYLLEGDSTKWIDGPLTRAVKSGAICYLDGVSPRRACEVAVAQSVTDDVEIQQSIQEVVSAIFE